MLVKSATNSFEILNEIEENHINILNELITDNEELRLKTEKEIKVECDSLRKFLKALEVNIFIIYFKICLFSIYKQPTNVEIISYVNYLI